MPNEDSIVTSTLWYANRTMGTVESVYTGALDACEVERYAWLANGYSDSSLDVARFLGESKFKFLHRVWSS